LPPSLIARDLGHQHFVMLSPLASGFVAEVLRLRERQCRSARQKLMVFMSVFHIAQTTVMTVMVVALGVRLYVDVVALSACERVMCNTFQPMLLLRAFTEAHLRPATTDR
jgi:hypothetical protein